MSQAGGKNRQSKVTRWQSVALLAFCGAACVHDQGQELRRALQRSQARASAKIALQDSAPALVRLQATTHDDRDLLLHWEHTAQGWKMALLPFDVFAASSPDKALRALVWAVKMRRWDVVIGLAPARFRQGLSLQIIEQHWTSAPAARELRQVLHEIEASPRREPTSDDNIAHLELPSGRRVVLEREGDRWVIAAL